MKKKEFEALVAEVMQDTWSDICTDTGFHPLDIIHVTRQMLDFRPRHWSSHIAGRLFSAINAPAEPAALGVTGETGLLKLLGQNQNFELSFDYGDEDEAGKNWCVRRVNGGVNDREWTLIGSGATPEAALTAALAATGRGD